MDIIKIINLEINFIIILTLSSFFVSTTKAEPDNQLIDVNFNLFAADIFEKVVAGSAKNLIFSPASIQTCLGLAFFASEGKTAQEMRKALRLGNGLREDIAISFKDFMQSSFMDSSDDNAVHLRMANRIYVNENLQLRPKFNEIATKAFQSEAEAINFTDSKNAISKINKFVGEKTHHKIKNLLKKDSVDKNTSVVLVNAIYFKGKWEIPFSADNTHKSEFNVNKNNKVQVDTMHMSETVQYGEFSELDAKVLELRYANSNLSMLFLLPNLLDGLKNMEKNLAGKDFNEIASKLEKQKVYIFIPKFRITYDLNLKRPLKELGLKDMFTNRANFSGLINDGERYKVSDVKHKAFIDVNEAGSEAEAATYVKFSTLVIPPKEFIANHPFAFAIRDSRAVYFAGHVVKFKGV